MSNTYIVAMRPMPSSLIQCSAGVLRVRSAGPRVSRRPSWGRSKSSKLFWYKYNDDICFFRWVDNCHDDVKEMVSKTAGASAQSKLHYWSMHCSLLCTRFKKKPILACACHRCKNYFDAISTTEISSSSSSVR